MAIDQSKDHPLNIYRASAGSGKTHLLTGFYLKLLFDPQLLPPTHSGEMKFSEILAVTFTNKATSEMKSRIISQLFLLSRDPASSDYWTNIAPCFAKPDLKDEDIANAIRHKATQLLIQMLNEYSSFNISTIDSFFQRIVRSFARELNIPGNYEVELDADHVLEAAVTNFLDKLSEKDNPDLFRWMVRYSENRLEEGKGWDIRDSLLNMAKKVLVNETYRQHSEAIREFTSDTKRLHDYASMLDTIQREWRERAVALGKQGKDLLELNGLKAEEFKFKGAGTISYFFKLLEGSVELPGKRFNEFAESPEKHFPKGVSQNVLDAMQQLSQECIEHTSGTPYINYMTARAIRSNFYQLGIIASIDKEVTTYCNEQNVMLLSSTTEMLSRLIAKDDAPFIYEKTGTRIHSYMIDEFQDTSRMQWGNFMPLLSNSLAEGYQDLIVGDVKQSIYRWRGGDWNLLNTEIGEFEKWAHHDDDTSLTTNWRSLPQIVEFNNDFFTFLAKELDKMINSSRIRAIFDKVAQLVAPPKQGAGKPEGFVNISFLEPLDENGNVIEKPKAEDFKAEASRRLPDVIIELQQHGFRPRDIAILCRRNDECSMAAEALLRYKNEHPDSPYGMDIISAEALLIAVRPTIQALINLMRLLQTPDSDILRAIAWSSFYQLDGCTIEESLVRYFDMHDDQRAFHPELTHRPLYEMTEELISLFPESARQLDAPFLQAFRDLVLEFVQTQGSNLASFLAWWDQTGHKKSITTPDGQDAIRIMSIHKSKGLEAPAVVLPYASWEIDLGKNNDDILWCEPKEDPFRQDIILPITLRMDLEQTIFCDDFTEERERIVIDNLNTAYVAFTRARETMVVLSPKPTSKKEGSRLEDMIQAYCKEKGNPDALTLGSWPRQTAPGEPPSSTSSSASKVTPCPDGSSLELPFSPSAPVLSTRPHLPQLSILHDPAKPDVTAKEKGNYIHMVMQGIRTADEASQVIDELYARGAIDEEMIDKPQMQATIARILKMSAVSPWFQPGMQILNELTLMDTQGRQQRPDRIVITPSRIAIVIDYKTGASQPGYRRQVASYMRILQKMGYPNVKGFLLFIKDEKVQEVKLTR